MGWLVLALMVLCVVGQVAVYAWLIYDIERARERSRKELAEFDRRIKALRNGWNK